MYRVSDAQIDFMLEDMEARGIVLEELRDNLLDHMCCIIEVEMTDGQSFEKFYESVSARFFKKELSEIQAETENLLRFKNFYSMKKIMNISGIATVALTILGALLKTFHLPGAGISIVLGGFFFGFIFLPILIAIKLKDEESVTDKIVFSFGLALAMMLSTGIMFKLMHWPGANVLSMASTIIFTFVYVPIYFFTRVRRPELRFNAIVNSVLMMACGGMFFSLFNIGYSYSFEKNMPKSHVYLHENSQMLFASNERLFSTEYIGQPASELHKISDEVNSQIEIIAAKLVEHKKHQNLDLQFAELRMKVGTYNAAIAELSNTEALALDTVMANNLHRLNPPLQMTAMARLQQQLAVNENCVLTAQLVSQK